VDPVPDPLLFFVVPGNRTRDPVSVVKTLTTRPHRRSLLLLLLLIIIIIITMIITL
jgi:hypothetical protein